VPSWFLPPNILGAAPVEKLKLSAFSPLIAKTDKYLSGWQASLLNPMGRSVLVNAVLDSQLIYTMSVLLLPQGTIDAIDRRRRSFLWTGEDPAHGAQCLVAWENVCQPKEQGGLGIKNLPAQNKCLLLKMLHHLHHPGESAWAAWVREKLILPLWRAMSRVHTGRTLGGSSPCTGLSLSLKSTTGALPAFGGIDGSPRAGSVISSLFYSVTQHAWRPLLRGLWNGVSDVY
jgi:hypothetical protein